MSTPEDKRFGQLAVQMRLIKEEHLQECYKVQDDAVAAGVRNPTQPRTSDFVPIVLQLFRRARE